ncbi:type II toxin-antitoxin system VapB family antitoxin [Mesorhizobium sp. VK9D]|uniref:antitoxin n=1 Tax=Mesorhizobium australafricanum TaxID=3072311 RepID=UPI002A24EF02|nr:type II toxin-antitoxin system VapB family antitoxin [Mesorhizobium sp. VK9D]MDX8454378.1 type II toxin-antitoxin system VapB family antitoxin [Mesorhizobium sp. VK9D]
MNKAKIFWSGRSQAVRLPKEFRFETDEVSIRRHGQAIVLEPLPQDWAWLDQVIGRVDDDFIDAALDKPEEQERPALDDIFK